MVNVVSTLLHYDYYDNNICCNGRPTFQEMEFVYDVGKTLRLCHLYVFNTKDHNTNKFWTFLLCLTFWCQLSLCQINYTNNSE